MANATAEMTELTLTTFLADLADYNRWANQTLVEWLKAKPVELLDQEVPSSFPSLQKTLVHIWDTQRFWLAVLKQETPPTSFRLNGFHGTLNEVFFGIVEQSGELADYLRSLTEAELKEEVSFVTPWVAGTRSRLEFTQHCLNHSTYHRGQVVTIGRNLGLTDAPMTDYSFYFLVVK
ncbi:DinB family protein [Larkinella soli]|uniref:DinB family protein n=1 Tax=Larkinella soli TaxID=1770527 RepID=UPI000FFBAA58|nr:DinB family protein [Larkinella soli]